MVDIIPLDSLDIPQCDLFKIDIQGYEYFAFLGAQKLIENNKPIILLENHLNDLKNEFKSKEFLLNMGYELYRYNIGNKEDCILIHPESKHYIKSLNIINTIKDKYNIIKE
jgi:lipoate synthase